MPFAGRSLLAATLSMLPLTAAAQQVSYLDQDLRPATASSYYYKRVIQFKEELMNPHVGRGYYGQTTSTITGSGIYRCSLTDYFRNGQPALVVSVLSLSAGSCKNGQFDGPSIAYYPNGQIRQTATYTTGKLQGDVITYNQEGSLQSKEHYDSGVLLDKRAVSPNDPLLGTWEHADYGVGGSSIRIESMELRFPPEASTRLEFSQDGTVTESEFLYGGTMPVLKSQAVTSWTFTAKSPRLGTLEQYRGKDLVRRGEITWLNAYNFEMVITFDTDPSEINSHVTYTRR